jgi:integrase
LDKYWTLEENVARTVQDARLQTREARSKLPARAKPHYRTIEEGLHLGYRKPRGRRGKPAPAGKWLLRSYRGGQNYRVETIGIADDFSDADGVVILDFAQAQNKARVLHVQRAHAAAGIAGPLTVAAALEKHLEHLAGEGKNVTNQRYHTGAFIIPALGDVEVGKLTAKQLRRWHHGLAGVAPRLRTAAGLPQQHQALDVADAEATRRRRSSANRILTTLKAALNHVWREKLVPSDGEWRRVTAFKSVDSARVRYLTIAEAKRLINACDPEFRLLVTAALQTGARYQELARLKVGDFNPDAGTLAILQSKSGKSRHVVLTDEGQAFFRQLAAGRNSEQLLLCRADGSAWGRSHQQSRMAAACRRAKIEPAVGIHALRHTWASLAVMHGMPLMVVARNLGHADVEMVQKFYGHLSRDFVTDAVREHAPRFGIAKSNVTALR